MINNTEIKLSSFADDTSLALDGSESSLKNALDELTTFEKLSGLKVNFDKTQVIWIGNKKFSSDSIKTKFKLLWGQTEFKLLGITFHVDLNKLIDLNFNCKLEKLQNSINHWKRRLLTPLGRLTVIKTLLVPTLNHMFISLPNPNESVLKKINSMII